jgi:hypothetical protein
MASIDVQQGKFDRFACLLPTSLSAVESRTAFLCSQDYLPLPVLDFRLITIRIIQMITRLLSRGIFRCSIIGTGFLLAVVNAQAAELLPFPSQTPVQQQQYSQPYSQELERPASAYADKFAAFGRRISNYSCKDLNDLIKQLRTSYANASNESKTYYKGLVDITNKKRLDSNCTE